MGSSILRGITTALLVTVVTLFAGIIWGALDLGGLSISRLLDIGLLASCLVGGYRTAKESGEWLLGGIVGASYVVIGTLLLALFLPIRGWGFIQILIEGAIIGLVAGAIGAGAIGAGGAGRAKGMRMSGWSGNRSQFTPTYASYDSNDVVSSKFDWDREKEVDEWKEAPLNNWLESSSSNRGAHREKWDFEESPEVQWSWDMEQENLIDSGPKHLEPLPVWKPDPVRTNVLGRNKASLNNSREKIVKYSGPWWEQ